MTVTTREEILIRRQQEREKNLELYNLALQKLKEDELRLQNDIQNDIEKEIQQKLKEREFRVNRFSRDADEKRLRKYNILKEKLSPITLQEHKQNINDKLQEIKQKEREHEEELKKIIEQKRTKRLENLKPKLRREIEQKKVESINPIEEKVQSWYNEFLKYADGKTGVDFLTYSKSEDGVVELEKLMLKYRQNLSVISRKNEHIQQLRKRMFDVYMINLF